MKKKIFIYISLFCFVFTFVYVQPSKHYEAAILSKVASSGAKKVVKEVIKDMSVEMATNYALNEAFRIASEAEAKYKVQDNYKVICATAVSGGDCTKPVQVKTALTEADKISVGHQAELELEKLITNGKGFSRWQKFMDWFLPIWLVSLTVTAITYALDPEVRSLFNEAGYNALVALGLIKPVYETETKPLAEYDTVDLPEATPENTNLTTYYKNATSWETTVVQLMVDLPNENNIIKAELDSGTNGLYHVTMNLFGDTSTSPSFQLNTSDREVRLYSTDFHLTDVNYKTPQITFSTNGVVNSTKTTKSTFYNTQPAFAIPTEWTSILIKQVNSVTTRSPYEINGFWYTDVLYNTADGNALSMQIRTDDKPGTDRMTFVEASWQFNGYPNRQNLANLQIWKDKPPNKIVLEPVFDDIATNDFPKSTYENGSGQVSLIPPTAIPHKQTSTGTTLTPVIDETTGDKKYITPVGDEVPEEDITVEDPIIEKTPEGTTYTPPATETNPNPEPIPLTPPEPTPGGEEPPTDPPTDEEPPPEGGSKKPNVPLALLLGLFKLLIAILYYLIRLFTFIVTIQFIEPTVIDNPTFQWFKTATVLGIQPYPLVINMAIFFLSFSIYKSIRRVFG